MTLKVQAIRKWIDKKTSGLDKGRVAYTTFLTCSMTVSYTHLTLPTT